MGEYYKTHILVNLTYHNLLRNRLRFLFKEDAGLVEQFLKSLYSNEDTEPDPKITNYLPILLKHGLVSENPQTNHSRCSLLAVTGVNFELTYACNKNCSHCLQQGIRRTHVDQLSTQAVKDAIFQVYLAGLCNTGINFTGGEVLGNREDLFEILKYTLSLGIQYRLNSNSWWSRARHIRVGNQFFPTPLDLVLYLKGVGLGQFAFSYDERLKDANLMNNLVESIKICEMARVGYQIIFTGIESGKINGIVDDLRRAVGFYLYYMIPVRTEMVDIGGCTGATDAYAWQSNKAPCADKGFYHPAFLHISPDGKVRTCMYAVGSANVGDITQKPLVDIINGFPSNEIGNCFSNVVRKQETFDELVTPYLSMYRPMVHECTRNAVLARFLEMIDSGEPNRPEIYRQIAVELGLDQSG